MYIYIYIYVYSHFYIRYNTKNKQKKIVGNNITQNYEFFIDSTGICLTYSRLVCCSQTRVPLSGISCFIPSIMKTSTACLP
jgi:hypothetical protein